MRQSRFRSETPSDHVELAAAQRSDKVAPDCDLVSVAADKALLCQNIDPPIERSTNLGAETGPRKLCTFSGHQPAVEPGRPLRYHLLVETEIRADRECDPLTAPCIIEMAELHDPADWTIPSRFNIGELEMMNAPVDAVDEIGRAHV